MGFSDAVAKILDPYDRQARLYPSLLVIAPISVVLVCLYGKDNIVGSTILSILGFCGVGYALSRVARDAGKKLQERAFTKWGGAPTTQLLRHANTHFDSHTKERYHRVLSKGIGKPLPMAIQEAANPAEADELYRAAVVWLIGKTRDTKAYPLIFKENIAFGFQRNVLGLRKWGVLVATICVAWILLFSRIIATTAPFFRQDLLNSIPPAAIVALLVSVALLVCWLFLFNEEALKRTGFSYAERLLQSCDHIKSPPKSAKAIAV